jgi:hypothetical protein
MAYKYNGLRVYDTVQKMSFVYIDNDWEKESSETIATTSGSGNGMNLGGTENFIPKITSTGTTSSIIREYTATGNQRRIGINVPTNKPVAEILHVIGNSKFEGQITATSFVGNISGNNVQSPVNVDKLSNPNDSAKTYVLKSINNTNQWVLETTGSNIQISKNVTDTLLYLVLSKDASTSNNLYIAKNDTNDLLAANATTRQLMVGTSNNHINPQYSFSAKLGTGMYGNTSEVGLSMDSVKRIYVTSTMVGINVGTNTIAKFEAALTTISSPTTITGTTTINGNTKITGITTIAGTTNITGATTITGTNTLTVTGVTTLSSTLAVTGVTTLSSTLVVSGATTLSSTLAVSGATTLSSTLTISTNTSPGIKITSSGEFLRSIQSSGTNFNYMSFYKTDTATPNATNGRRGYIGYGSITGDVFYIYNETATGSINFHTNGNEMLSIGTDTITVKSAKKLDLSDVVISAMRGTNEFNFVNNNNFSQTDKSVYINYRGVSNAISSYRFHNGSGNMDALSPIVTGGIQLNKGNLLHRIVVGSVGVARDGTHAINKGSNFVEIGVGSTSGVDPIAVIKFKTAMPSTNYNVFVSFSNILLMRWVVVAQVVDATSFRIKIENPFISNWSGELEVNFMAVCYDN